MLYRDAPRNDVKSRFAAVLIIPQIILTPASNNVKERDFPFKFDCTTNKGLNWRHCEERRDEAIQDSQ